MASSSVAHVKISISGFKYSEYLSEAIRSQMPKDVDAEVVGERAPAAGPELLVALTVRACDCAVNIALENLLKQLWRKARAIIRRHTGAEPLLTPLVIEYPEYQLTFIDHSFINGEGMGSLSVNAADIDEVAAYITESASNGRRVLGVTMPVKIVDLDSKKTVVGWWNRSGLWLIRLTRESGEFYYAVYDSARQRHLHFDTIGADLRDF